MWPAEEKVFQVLAASPLVRSAWLFGSQASGRSRSDSDIDLGIVTSRPLHWTEYADLHQELVGAARTDAIDLSVLNEAGPVLRYEAVRGRNLLCKKPEQQAAFVSLAAREYEDHMLRLERFLEQRRA